MRTLNGAVTDRMDVGEKPDAVSAFENLRKVVGDAWDDIDPEEYVRELRADKLPLQNGQIETT